MCDLFFLFFLVLFASWGTWQLLHHLVVIAVCASRLTSIFMNPTCREWRRVPASQSTSFTVVYTLLRVWWWFLWFCLYIFDLQEKKTHTKEIGRRFIFVSLLTFTHECTWTFTWCLCVCGWVCGVPYDWTDYLFISRFPSHINVFRWFQKVSRRLISQGSSWEAFGLCVNALVWGTWIFIDPESFPNTVSMDWEVMRWRRWGFVCVTSLKLPLRLLLNERSDPFSLRAVLLRLTSEKSCGRLSETMPHWLSQLFNLHDAFAPRRLQLTSPRCY